MLESATIVESDPEVGQQLTDVLKPICTGDLPRYSFGAVIGVYSGPHVAGIAFVVAQK